MGHDQGGDVARDKPATVSPAVPTDCEVSGGSHIEACDTVGRALIDASSSTMLIRLDGNEQVHDMLHLLDVGPLTDHTGDVLEAVLRQCTERAGGVVVELDYFDLDYRSEITAVNDTVFSRTDFQTRRLHFFRAEVPDDISAYAYIGSARDGYLGYAIIRPHIPGPVGRCLLAPTLSEALGIDDDPPRVRTGATEVVTILGHSLDAHGVPFMQQDGVLLRCGHVATWICHYTATLHGLTNRVPTALLNVAAGEPAPLGRQLGSDGTDLTQLVRMNTRIGLPPEVADFNVHAREPEISWHHRPELAALVGALDVGPDPDQDEEHDHDGECVPPLDADRWPHRSKAG